MIILYAAIILTALASYTDLRKRFIPDKITYFLMIIGVIYWLWVGLRGDFKVEMLSFVLHFGGFYLLSALLFYSGAWGGGDAKLLIGLGAAVGRIQPLTFLFFLVFFAGLSSFVYISWRMSEGAKLSKITKENLPLAPAFLLALLILAI